LVLHGPAWRVKRKPLGGKITANESKIRSMDNTTPTLKQFIELRLGKQTSEINTLKEMLVRSFGANSFHEFWRYWNPVYGYYLYYKCYKPLRKYFPRYMCVILTFAASGFFLHDLPFGWWIRFIRFFQTGHFPIPFVTIWFSLMGVITLITRALQLDIGSNEFAFRVIVNNICIIVPFALILGLMQIY
jgi:hypothetical protein